MNTTIKKNFAILAIIAAIVMGIVTVGTSLAYFFNSKDHDSAYQLSKIQTEIVEEFKKTDNEKIYQKNPRIKNVGASDCIVRVQISVTPSNQELTLDGLDGNKNWAYNTQDGYYYYQGVVSPDKETETLFDRVIIDDIENMQDFDIIIYNEAIQITAYDDNGKEISSLDTNGKYNQEKALALWQYYK